jgi:hypothetical protein
MIRIWCRVVNGDTSLFVHAKISKKFLISLANTFDLIKAFIFHKNHSSSLEFVSDKKGLAKFSKTKNGMSNTLMQHLQVRLLGHSLNHIKPYIFIHSNIKKKMTMLAGRSLSFAIHHSSCCVNTLLVVVERSHLTQMHKT